MKLHTTVTLAMLATMLVSWADESDKQMPAVVANAETKVEVMMAYCNSTDECWPDPDTKVRFVDGRVVMTDFTLYPNRKARISDGLVAFNLNGKWGACDETGRVILPATFDFGFEFHEGLAAVNKGDKDGFINKQGEWVIEPRFDAGHTGDFIGNVCVVHVGGEVAVIDRKGNYVWKRGLLKALNLGGGIFIETADGLEGFLDDSGSLLPDREPNRRYFKGKE